MIDTGLKRLLDFVYGNHPKSQKLKERGAKVIEFLRRTPYSSVYAIAEEMGLDYSNPQDRKKFYNTVSPMKNWGMLAVTKDKENKVRYFLSFEKFQGKIEERVINTARDWLNVLK